MADGMDNTVSVLEASSAGVKDMADGSLRITFEFEPRHAAAAFALFGTRGSGVAIAALKDGRGAHQEHPPDAEPEPERLPGGPLSKLAGRWCHEHEFMRFLKQEYPDYVNLVSMRLMPDTQPNEVAAEVLRQVLGIKSRADLDHNPDAAEAFHTLIRGPYCKRYLAQRG